jgi:primosomal protein N'
MVTFDCPFCDQPVGLEADSGEARCDECSVVLELASEAGPAEVAMAA